MHACLSVRTVWMRSARTQKWKQIQLAAGARAYKIWGGGGGGGGWGVGVWGWGVMNVEPGEDISKPNQPRQL
jgi:hypothetical protein